MASPTAGPAKGPDALADTIGEAPRPSILVLLGSYLPGYKAGGPIRSIENLVAALGGELDFRIVTVDRDLGEKSPYRGVPTNRWARVGQAEVMYLPPRLPGLLRMCALLCAADRNTVVYLNSFFGRRHSMLAILMRWLGISRPRCLVLAPRGEFSPGAMRFKRRRKSLYISISRWFGLHRGIVWHASSNFEAEDIIRHFPQTSEINLAGPICELEGATRAAGRNETIVASDIAGTELPVRRDGRLKKPGQLSAVFISRLSRKKNLAGALRMLKGVPGDVSFDIYGPAEDPEYWSECQGLIAALPPNIRVRYEGEIKHERVREVFAHHDLFLFPTLGENFGHVISEALLAGCPVLTSDQTPWRNLEAEGVGWDLPLCETERFRSVLQQCVDSDSEWLAALSSCAAKYAAKLASDPQSVNAHRKLFQRAHAWPNSPRSTMAL